MSPFESRHLMPYTLWGGFFSNYFNEIVVQVKPMEPTVYDKQR